MKTGLKWALFGATMVACVALGYGAYTLAGISWNSVVEYDPVYSDFNLAPAAAGSETASRTVLVIVDGLRLDASRRMNTLEALRATGTEVVLTAPQPSLSYPNWTTILTGAPPELSGVVTNWHDGRAPVESLFDTAAREGVSTVFVGPEDFDVLYGVKDSGAATFMREWEEEYLSAEYVDAALRLAETEQPRLLVVHLPDVDEAGHSYGGASEEYAAVVAKVDADIGRMVEALQDGRTTFLIVADHGHIDTGGHGGWEDEVVSLPGVLAGPGIAPLGGTGHLVDVAPTVALMAGIPAPRFSAGVVLQPVASLATNNPGIASGDAARVAFAQRYAEYVHPQGAAIGGVPQSTEGTRVVSSVEQMVASARAARMRADRIDRLPLGIGITAASLLFFLLVLIASWRALVTTIAGATAYYLVYNTLFFVVHGYRWSLSSFNSEDLIDTWMNGRLIEAAVAGLIAAVVAGIVYPMLRVRRSGPSGQYLAGWLTLGPTTVLVILATLGLQVAWFVWAYGVVPEWRLPNLMWGFKYDLDLIQATALGFVAVVTPLVTYLVGRYHPMITHPHTKEWPHGDQGPA